MCCSASWKSVKSFGGLPKMRSNILSTWLCCREPRAAVICRAESLRGSWTVSSAFWPRYSVQPWSRTARCAGLASSHGQLSGVKRQSEGERNEGVPQLSCSKLVVCYQWLLHSFMSALSSESPGSNRANLVNLQCAFMFPQNHFNILYRGPFRSSVIVFIEKAGWIPKCLALRKTRGKLLLTSVAGSPLSSCSVSGAGKDIK